MVGEGAAGVRDLDALLLGRRGRAAGPGVLLLAIGLVLTVVVAVLMSPRGTILSAPAGGAGRLTGAAALPGGFASPGVGERGHVAPPVELAVPVLAIRSELVGLRLNADGSLQVPSSYGQAGWYRDGSSPGTVGVPAILVGHVDSHTGPGVFYRLHALRPGDQVLIRRADGSTAAFTVYRTAQFAKAGFPAAQVYAPTSRPELRLITCSGRFDRTTRSYLGNLVVYAAA